VKQTERELFLGCNRQRKRVVTEPLNKTRFIVDEE